MTKDKKEQKAIKIQLDEELIGRLKVYAYLHNMKLGDVVGQFLMQGLPKQ